MVKIAKKVKILSNSAKEELLRVFLQQTIGAFTIRGKTGSYCLFHDPPENFWHYHDFYEVCLVLSGRGKHHLEKTEINVQAGDLFIADPGVFHLISSYDTKDLYLAFFSMEIIQNHPIDSHNKTDILISNFINRHQLVSHHNEIQGNILKLINKNRKTISEPIAQQNLFAWIMEAIASLAIEKEIPRSDAVDTKHKKLQMALEFIESQLQGDIKIADIANHVHASERTTRRIFKELTGKAIIQVINEQKIKYVAHLLHQQYTLSQCASKLNGISTSQLSKLFKKVTGLSPKDYKESIQQPIYHPQLFKSKF